MPLPPIPSNYDLIRMLEEKVGLQSGFLVKLYEEDDWSFIIKLHALMEAACTHLIVAHLEKPELADIISRLELSGKTLGKTVILKRLNLLGEYNRRFISALSELRNKLVHDIRFSNFTLLKYVQSLDPKSIKNFAESFAPQALLDREVAKLSQAIQQSRINAGQSVEGLHIRESQGLSELIERVQADPKLYIWTAAYTTLGAIVEMDWYSDFQQWLEEKRTFERTIDEV
jgi:hypothetical protein